jgi:hypothetical protein
VTFFRAARPFLKAKPLKLEGCHGTAVLLHQLLIEGILVVPSFLFGFDDAGFDQDLEMMANGWLGEVNNFLDVGTMAASALFGDMLQNPEAVNIPQSFGNLFDLLETKRHGCIH